MRNQEQLKRVLDTLYSSDESEGKILLRLARTEFALNQVRCDTRAVGHGPGPPTD